MSETKTEIISRELLKQCGFYNNSNINIEEKISDVPKINKLLKNASKSNKGGPGRPEFIISNVEFNDFVIVIECKENIKFHESKNRDKYKDYAVDGVLNYASYLSKSYNVISIAISGNKKNNINISTFLTLKGSKYKNLKISEILKFEEYVNLFLFDEEKVSQEYDQLLSYSTRLNKKLHIKKITENNRCLLISGILIALKNRAFNKSYNSHKKSVQLIDALIKAISDEISNRNLPSKKVNSVVNTFQFMKTNPSLIEDDNFLVHLIDEINERINNFLKTYKYYDVLGEFYIQFLTYANSDKGLGIVLTPMHITELFCEVANINKHSIIYDNCCGTGGFLISSMRYLLKQVNSETEKNKIKEKNFIGTEYQDYIFTLASSNMILQGDGLTKIFNSDCFKNIKEIQQHKPNVGMLNPPFKMDKDDIEELEFVLNNLETLEPGSICLALLPMRCVMYDKGYGLELKKKIYQNHTIKAVCSLPNELFHNSDVGVVTCLLVVEAHKPHPENFKTYLGYWKDDGFVKRKPMGRVDGGNWKKIKESFISSYRNKEENPIFKNNMEDEVFSTNVRLKPEDEWCAEKFLKTNYENLDKEAYQKKVKEYFIYKIRNE